jgi:predicted ATPase
VDDRALPFLTRFRLRNYRSIPACDVAPGALAFLVGPNGAGKGAFLDALRFVGDALGTTLDHALRERGGINEVRRRSGGHPTHFGVRLDFRLGAAGHGSYAFELGARPAGGYEVKHEELQVESTERKAFFRVDEGRVTSSAPVFPAAARDRLYLVSASGLPEFRPAYDALASLSVHAIDPARIRDLQPADSGERLARDGGNLASVLGRIARNDPAVGKRIEEYLAAIAPGVLGVEPLALGTRETIEFRQAVPGQKAPWRFPAAGMSDGTLRALGVLVALFHGRAGGAAPAVVGIEEPEASLHPAAIAVLRDALREAARTTQVLVTTHSPALLDDPALDPAELLAVAAGDGATRIGPIDPEGRAALAERRLAAGELLARGRLVPDPG